MKKYNEIIPPHYKKLFYNWLKKQNILHSYLYTMQTIGRKVSEDRLVYIDELINHSFYWADSQQGRKFWAQFNVAWRKYLKRYLKTHPLYLEKATKIMYNRV